MICFLLVSAALVSLHLLSLLGDRLLERVDFAAQRVAVGADEQSVLGIALGSGADQSVLG